MTSYVVDASVAHRRTRPFDYSFQHRTTSWLVDVDAPNAAFPRWLRPLAQIRGVDHLHAGHGDLRSKLRATLSEHGLAWTAKTVKLLVNARSAGYVFDPLTTYFCFDGHGRLEGILAEVHNTYGERHCYPLPAVRTEAPAQPVWVQTAVDKAFYVSPFFAVEGRYDIRARLTDDEVTVSISLTQAGERVFTGSVHGRLSPATPGAVLRAVASDPFASRRVAALIRWHGVRLWLRRLPVVPRPAQPARRPVPKGSR